MDQLHNLIIKFYLQINYI